MNRRQGKFDEAERSVIQRSSSIRRILNRFLIWRKRFRTRQFSADELIWNRLIDLLPDQPIVKAQKEACNTIQRTADDAAVGPAWLITESLAADRLVLSGRLNVAIDHRDWLQAKELLEKMKGVEDASQFAYAARPVPVGCYSILIARLQGEATNTDPGFAEARQLLSRKVETSPADAPSHPLLLSNLAVVDALLERKADALSEGKRGVDLVPISKDAIQGARVAMNLAVVYAWTGETDLAFQLLDRLAKTPYGLFLSDLKLSHYFDPLRKEPRYEKLLAELAPHD